MRRGQEAAVQRRKFPRIKRRVNCEVSIDGRRHVGVVLDLSPGGFFVQTRASPPVGAEIVVHLRRASDDGVEVQAKVANRRPTPARLASVARGGIGCALTAPPETYFAFLQALSPGP
jgi:hypothetical protein